MLSECYRAGDILQPSGHPSIQDRQPEMAVSAAACHICPLMDISLVQISDKDERETPPRVLCQSPVNKEPAQSIDYHNGRIAEEG